MARLADSPKPDSSPGIKSQASMERDQHSFGDSDEENLGDEDLSQAKFLTQVPSPSPRKLTKRSPLALKSSEKTNADLMKLYKPVDGTMHGGTPTKHKTFVGIRKVKPKIISSDREVSEQKSGFETIRHQAGQPRESSTAACAMNDIPKNPRSPSKSPWAIRPRAERSWHRSVNTEIGIKCRQSSAKSRR